MPFNLAWPAELNNKKNYILKNSRDSCQECGAFSTVEDILLVKATKACYNIHYIWGPTMLQRYYLSIALSRPAADVAISIVRSLLLIWKMQYDLKCIGEVRISYFHSAPYSTTLDYNHVYILKKIETLKDRMRNLSLRAYVVGSLCMINIIYLCSFDLVGRTFIIPFIAHTGIEVLGFMVYERVAAADKKMQEQAWWIQGIYLTIEILPYALGVTACYNQSAYGKLLVLGCGAIIAAASDEMRSIKDTLNHLPVIRGYMGNLIPENKCKWITDISVLQRQLQEMMDGDLKIGSY